MTPPTFADPESLRREFLALLEARYPDCLADRGFVTGFDPETGEVTDRDSRHLVATCRYVSNFSLAVTHDARDPWLETAVHGLEFLERAHRDSDVDGNPTYRWLFSAAGIDDPDGSVQVVDDRLSTYGHAFVVLAHARAADAGLSPDATAPSDAVADLEVVADPAAIADAFLDRFYEPEHGLCRSDLDADGEPIEPYRGQNANMHACEALLAAARFTGDAALLERAETIARRITVDLTAETDGLVWEHYTPDWNHDFEYNEDTPRDQFRPWGYQPGHHAEWAKLLGELDREGITWALDRGIELFDAAVDLGWDDDRGGFYYAVEADGTPVAAEKYGWAVAEAIGAAAVLFERTGDERFRRWHDRLWNYAAGTLRAPTGMWRERVSADNEPIPPTDAPPVEPDYHPIGACHTGLESSMAIRENRDGSNK
ncbi:N-acylglucosamine 2-epimerase [Halalkaliarchaeum desulfuricum]|uniref:N-acylglucosamine 2-epimerase n=1 Tax=Halalkaliarchaeum desulfuricum TaxID=2055893 RepID=A0A343TLT9_9EURY|nr:AGE family epimerase/isomerase [Halalkaliarchaeum desulfuricum]AUX10061.1 N-acylglucosamine 2-epimerase [Halalkaliarchaeum desulfuricum]